MTEHVQNAQHRDAQEAHQTGVVIASEDVPEFLRKTAEVLENEGEVLVQTSEDVGNEMIAADRNAL